MSRLLPGATALALVVALGPASCASDVPPEAIPSPIPEARPATPVSPEIEKFWGIAATRGIGPKQRPTIDSAVQACFDRLIVNSGEPDSPEKAKRFAAALDSAEMEIATVLDEEQADWWQTTGKTQDLMWLKMTELTNRSMPHPLRDRRRDR